MWGDIVGGGTGSGEPVRKEDFETTLITDACPRVAVAVKSWTVFSVTFQQGHTTIF